jgi:hypothetical protein
VSLISKLLTPLPPDGEELMGVFRAQFPTVECPIHVQDKEGTYLGISGKVKGTFRSYDELRWMKAEAEAHEDYLFSGQAPGVSYAQVDASGTVTYDNSHYDIHSPPPQRWASPEVKGGADWLKSLLGR